MGDLIDVDFEQACICSCCHKRPATRRCDFPVYRVKPYGRHATCDRPLCRECAIHIPGDIDVCPDCAERLRRAWQRQELRLKK